MEYEELIDFSYGKKKCIGCGKEWGKIGWFIARLLRRVENTPFQHTPMVTFFSNSLRWIHKCGGKRRTL